MNVDGGVVDDDEPLRLLRLPDDDDEGDKQLESLGDDDGDDELGEKIVAELD